MQHLLITWAIILWVAAIIILMTLALLNCVSRKDLKDFNNKD